ncbi:20700_t:CDS:2, partial [Dentiscutata erythropus]
QNVVIQLMVATVVTVTFAAILRSTCRCVHCHRCSGYFGDGETSHSPDETLELSTHGKRLGQTNIKEANVNNVESNNLSSNNDEPHFDIYQYFSSLKLEDPIPLEK